MNTLNDFELKQRKYMPVFPKASGKPTIYIEGYPYEDDEPMPAGEFHGMQMHGLFDQFRDIFRHTRISMSVWTTLSITVKAISERSWLLMCMSSSVPRNCRYEGVFIRGQKAPSLQQFLSSFQIQQRLRTGVEVYLRDMGVAEYFIHQPDMNRPIEFRGWRRDALGDIVEIEADADEGLFSASLNLYFRWELHEAWELRLLRPYLPDGTAITTSMEEHHLRVAAEELVAGEAERRQAAERLAREEAERRQVAIEAELERLRAQLANSENESE